MSDSIVQAEVTAPTRLGALARVQVLDFTWVRAGPWCIRWLGALGAEVIKVEWPQSPNTRGNNIATGTGTSAGKPADLNINVPFRDINASKPSLNLNTRTTIGINLTRHLMIISNIVIENFVYGVLDRWALGFENMKKLLPGIFYLYMSDLVHTDRDRDDQPMRAIAQALLGLTYRSGLSGEPPAGCEDYLRAGTSLHRRQHSCGVYQRARGHVRRPKYAGEAVLLRISSDAVTDARSLAVQRAAEDRGQCGSDRFVTEFLDLPGEQAPITFKA